MSQSPEVVTRIQVAGSEFVPIAILRAMLLNEEDFDVIRTILLNPRTPLKAIEKFVTTDLAEQFEDDKEITSYLATRAGNSIDKDKNEK